MATVELNVDAKSREAMELVRLVAETAPDLLEALDEFFPFPNGCETLTCDFERPLALGTSKLTGVVKLGDKFLGSVAAMRTRYIERGFVVPCSLDVLRHSDSPG